ESRNVIVNRSVFGSLIHFRIGSIGFTEFYIVPDGITEQKRILRYITYSFPKFLEIHGGNIFSVNQDFSFLYIIQSTNQIEDRRLPGTCLPNDRQGFSAFHFQGNILEGSDIGIFISETYVLK